MKHLVLLCLAFSFALSTFAGEPNPPATLRNAAAGLFAIGVGINDRIPNRPLDWPLLKAQFGAVTPENCLKPNPVQVAEGKFNFTLADAFVNFAVSNHLQVVGHCLVWAKDDRTPAWFYRDGTNVASRALLLARMKTHIDAVAGRYRGRMAMWDVVNEALDDGTNFLRPSGWSAACGEEFIIKAFEYAHAADPQALLIYNDYNNELPVKREKLIRLVRMLREKNAPLHAIGLQGHYEIDRLPLADIEATLKAMRELGVKVVVSELDIDVIPRGRWWADGGKYRDELSKLDPYQNGCPPEVLRRQADQYAQLFHLFRKHRDVIARVTFWNLHDGQSWLNGFPWKRVNHPLLFDREGNPKPAFSAVMDALRLPESTAQPSATGLYDRTNIAAWCIVPYDAKQRGPEERARMLKELGLTKLAYDWRTKHIPTFDAEVEAMKRHSIEIIAWWYPGRMPQTLEVIKRHGIHPQLWVCGQSGAFNSTGQQRVEDEAGRIRPIAREAAALGCKVGLYNHREPWFEDQLNQIAIIERLRQDGLTNVGIVFNFHHWRGSLDPFPALIERIKPHLLAVNLNGMRADTSRYPDVSFVGTGASESAMMRALEQSGWQGPVGIINEHENLDAAEGLARNLAGIERIRQQLREPGATNQP